MELVYLWVEDYKNIKKQGFNFSPRFRCEYDEENKELTIEENKEYIENFFGDNINITAIVGKNGSGKSSVIKSFIERFVSHYESARLFLSNDEEIAKVEEDEIAQNTFVVYWDYSITDETFFDITVDSESSKLNNKKNYIILPSKVDDNNNSAISISDDIQFLAKNIIEIEHSIDWIKDFFIPSYILIVSEEKIEDFEQNITDDDTIKQYFDDFYSIGKDKNFYKIPINKKDEVKSKIKNYNDDNIIIDFIIDERNDKKFLFLSFGEIQLLKILINLQKIIDFQKDKNIIFLLDELELGLHPNWQKYLIKYLLKLKISNQKIHFILTTHSPFLLSDLPKQNIIFLDTDEDGNCKVVDGLHDKKETFGANIHTLLSDSFFMQDGLMGEFAKSKIQEIMDFLNDKKTINEISINEENIKKVIKSIGEPFLKQKLEQMYFSKYPEAKNQKIKELEEELKRLKNSD